MSASASASAASSCPHLTWIRQPPKEKPVIHKEECTQCFQSDTSAGGVDVCLHCFNGGCTGADSMQHSQHHAQLCHPIVLNIKKRPVPVKEEDVEMKQAEEASLATLTPMEQLQATKKKLQEEAAEPSHFYETEVRCLQCSIVLDQTKHEPLAKCVEAVLASQTIAQSAGIAMTEETIVDNCTHCINLKQVDQPPQLGQRALTTCRACDVKDNMWLCLTCGVLGCSRRQMTGANEWSRGQGHAAAHADSTGHALVLKVGTLTAEGKGDVYCYKCDNTVIDRNLAQHVKTFGIEIDDSTTASVQSTADAALEMNLKMNWSLVFEADGKEAELAFGPGRTGLTNLGNSCYLASVLQVLFSLPHFQQRYFTTALQHLSTCNSNKPADCFQCQMSKIAIGLLSGRYDPQPSESEMAEITKERLAREERNLAIKEGRATEAQIAEKEADLNKSKRKPLQLGVPPRTFKRLIAGKHREFSTGAQQDSFEYLHFLLDYIKQKENADKFDPYQPFYFQQEDRLECTRCHRVRYSNVKTTELSLPIPLPEPLPPKEVPTTTTASSTSSGDAKKPAPKEYPPVSFTSCVNEWTRPQISEDWNCPHCQQRSSALKSSRLTTFPSVLMVHMRRFVCEGWVPVKLDIEIEFDPAQPGKIRLDDLRSKGLQAGEQELPKEPAASSSSTVVKVADAGIVSGLEMMGFNRNACQRAALAVDNASADAAATWLFSHMEDPDINDPLPVAAAASGSSSGGGVAQPSAESIENLSAMGFEPARCKYALQQCGNDAERAVEWLFSHADEDVPMEVVSDAPAASSQSKSEEVIRDMAPAGYELFAFVTHMGKSTGSGHYIAHVLKDGAWLQFNDHKVSYVSNPMRAAAYAYLYFFRRV